MVVMSSFCRREKGWEGGREGGREGGKEAMAKKGIGGGVFMSRMHGRSRTHLFVACLNPFRTPVPFRGEGTQIPSNLSPIAPKTRLPS